MSSALVPLPVAIPLAVAALLLIVAHFVPARVADWVSLLTALAAGAICIVLARRTAAGPLVYWFGNWAPRAGLVIGIGFVVDQTGAIVAAFTALLFAATFVFAWGYFDEIRAHFHALMLLFLGALIGFCLTHDLFNMFVWFEVMSVAAFALTGYALEAPALEGALNFTVTNAIASFSMLGGIGLIYSAAGQLDFSALGRAVAAAHPPSVIPAAFALLATALLIKAAIVPFQFWLSDAHAVAPSPVSVIFSGVMVAIGVFGLAKLYWTVFASSTAITAVVHTLLLWLGMATALIGGLACLAQRHIKRLLAFSTISHLGVLLIGFAALTERGTAGMFVYLVGHGLVKGSLFMGAGILLALAGGIDEIELRGRGAPFWPAGIAFAFGGLLLAGLPIGLMDDGAKAIDRGLGETGHDWARAALILGAGLTGAAVLRAAARVYLGWGAVPGEEQRGPSNEEREKPDRPLWLMLAPAALLLAVAVLSAPWAERLAEASTRQFMHPDAQAVLGAGYGAPHQVAGERATHAAGPVVPWIGVGLALLIAGYELGRRHLPRPLLRAISVATDPLFARLQRLHSGLVGDYVAWIMVGLAVFAAALALA
jgi:multicomponent Na+:H+ antiporter subunit D